MRNRGKRVPVEGFKSDFAEQPKTAETLDFGAVRYGQSYPYHCPTPNEAQCAAPTSPLGDAMDVDAVAGMLGCSPWTVRNRYLPLGLPHMRASARGRLVFFKTQVICWIVERQQKGGKE